MLLEEIIKNSSTAFSKLSKRDKKGANYSKLQKILDVDKYWDFNSSIKAVMLIKIPNSEELEVLQNSGGFRYIFENKCMKTLRIQNTFLMFCFKAMQMYYDKDVKVKNVIILPPKGDESLLKELVEIVDPSMLMVKISECYSYDLK